MDECFKDLPGPDEVLDVIIRNLKAGGICAELLKDCSQLWFGIPEYFFSLPWPSIQEAEPIAPLIHKDASASQQKDETGSESAIHEEEKFDEQ